MYQTIRNTRKLFCLIVAVVFVFGMLTGCASSETPSKPASDTLSKPASEASSKPASEEAKKPAAATKEITVGTEAGGPYAEFYKSIAKDFTDKTGINVKFVEVPHENMHERFITEAMAGSGSIDVFTTDQPWVSEFASKGFLEPLSKRLADSDKADFQPAALDAVKYKDELYGLPYLVHTPILYYRTDLFKNAGISKPPETMDEYREYAKKLTDSGSGVFGTIVEGKQHPEPVTHFLDRISQFGGSILDDKGNITFDSPKVVDTLKYMLALQYEDKSSPAGAVGYDCTDVATMFVQGKVAMAINWPYMYSMAKDEKQSKVAGKFDMALQPGGTSVAWSWGYGISSSSKNKDAAWEFVKWSASTEVLKQFGIKFINPVPRKSAQTAIDAETSVNANDKKAISVMSGAVAKGKVVANFPQFPAIQESLAVSISKVMSKQNTPEKEVKSAAAQFKDIMSR